MKLSAIASSFALANMGRLASAQFMDAVVDYAISNLAPPNMTIPGVLEHNSSGSSLFGDRKLKGSSSERPQGRKNRGLKGPKGDEAFKECPCWDDTYLADLDPSDVSSVWIGASILGVGWEKDTPYFELAWATSVFSNYGDTPDLDEQDGLERFKGNLGEDSGKYRRALSNQASAGRQDERKLQGDLYDFGDRVYSTWVPTGQCGYFPGFNEWWMAFTEETNEKKAGLKSRECTRETGDALYQWADDNEISCYIYVSWCIGTPRSAFTHGYLGTIFGCPGIPIPCESIFDR
mmetsp:Transcript_2030/g.4413  ORF Transcript_2030/g.4413 Transcript_2030/m.4413 type:complete len:291 (+) Transcript_2030:182-1054(+)